MEIGSIVRFSSHPRPFAVEEAYCDNPDCSCNEAWLTFTEFYHPDESRSKPLSFRIRVDLETWQECDPPPRQPRVTRWVQEFLAQCPEARKSECRAEYERGKEFAKRIAEYVIAPQEVLSGELVSFSDVLTDKQALSSGGRGYTHRFRCHQREYSVEDLYCANPSCDCQSFHLQFWEQISPPGEDKQEVMIAPSFSGIITFAGELKIERTGRRQHAEAERILSAWWQAHQYDLDMYQRRYERVKEIGRRSLDRIENHPTRAAPSAIRIDQHPPRDNAPRLFTSPDSERVGRNDPCPCGSGKKFKRCCAKQHRNS